MTCSFAQLDGAFVLGALAPAERLQFERHLAGCDECARSVRELAGLPGLLARVDPRALEDPPDVEPVPVDVLPTLLRDVRRTRRRRIALVGAAAAAAVVLTAGGFAGGLAVGDGDRTGPGDSAQPASPGAGAAGHVTMEPAVETGPGESSPVRASVSLEGVPWGTQLHLRCTYDPVGDEYELPDEVTYVLVVRTAAGEAERVGTWRSVRGRTMQLTSATATDREEIRSVEVQTMDGRTVLSARL